MPAACTQAVEFELVGLDGKAVFRSDLLLQPFDLTVLEFHDLPAARADQVVMVSFMDHVVVLGLCSEVARLGSDH